MPTAQDIPRCPESLDDQAFKAQVRKAVDVIRAVLLGGGAHDLLDGLIHPDTAADAVSRGSLIVGNATPKWGKLVVGAAHRFLQSNGTDVGWVAMSGDATLAAGALTIANDAVSYAKMQNVSAGSRLLGRGDSGAGDPQEITIGSGLSMSGTTLSATGGGVSDGDKGDITVSSSGSVWTIDNNVVSDGKLRDSAAVSVIGRSANSTGDPADIVAAANDRLLARTGDAVGFVQLTVGMIPDGIITKAKIENVTAERLLGRGEGGGNGAPQELTLGTGLSLSGTTLAVTHKRLIAITYYTSGSGTHNVASGCTLLIVEGVGGGGGGGGAAGASSNSAGGRGGGGGGFFRKHYSSPASSYGYAVGAAGSGGSAGNNAGSAGGNTSWDTGGTPITAEGGSGGSGSAAGTAASLTSDIGGGSVTGTVELAVRGQCGSGGIRLSGTQAYGGKGGASFYGTGAVGRGNAGTGNAAEGYGGGGGGGMATSSSQAGGNGSAGIIIVYEYA